MKQIILKLKSSKLVNQGFIKKIKDKIYFKYIDPKLQAKTDRYRGEILDCLYEILGDTKWMLSCGGFLRYYRDQTMDGQDLDIYMLTDDLERMLPTFIDHGFTIKQVFYNAEGTLTEYRLLYKDVEVDIFHVFQDETGYYHYFTLEDNAKATPEITRSVEGNEFVVVGPDYISWRRHLPDFEVQTYEFEGSKFKGPKHAVDNIVALYGESWQVYDPHFDPRREPANNRPIPVPGAKSVVFTKPVKLIDSSIKNMNKN